MQKKWHKLSHQNNLLYVLSLLVCTSPLLKATALYIKSIYKQYEDLNKYSKICYIFKYP